MPTVLGNKREGQARARQGEGGYVVYEEDIHYLVEADYEGQPQQQILATSGLPQVNQSLIGSLMCSAVDAQSRAGEMKLYEVICTFSSQVSENTDPGTPQQGDPTAWVPIADVTFEPYTEVVRKDVNDKAWVNSANKPFETGLEVPRRIASVTFTQFERLGSVTVDALVKERSDRMNASTYKGYPKHTMLLMIDRATIGFFYGVRCWRIQYTMKYKDTPPLPSKPNSGGWHIQQLDAGWSYYDSGTLTQFEEDGVQFIGLLDGDGAALADQQNDDPVFLAFAPYKTVNFNSFLRV